MKYLLSFCLIFSALGINAQEVEGYETNRGEYYIAKFQPGKDMSDMMKYVDTWSKWAKKSSVFEDYRANIHVPYFHDQHLMHDLVWYGRAPNAEAHFAILDEWVNNGQKIAAQLPVDVSQVIEVWQRDVSRPEGSVDGASYVIFQDCKLDEGVTSQQVYDAYFTFAEAAKKLGDNLGRKMMWPISGHGEWDYDFVVVMYANSLKEYGKNNQLYWDKVNGIEEQQALSEVGYECSNRRTYSSTQIFGY